MISSSDQNHLENLKKEHGERPLIDVLRQMVVQLDQKPDGSEEHTQLLHALKILTGQFHFDGSASLWLDWLEQSEDELSWEKVGQKTERKRVEFVDDEPKANKVDIPLEGEQAIWAKALDRQEKKKGGISIPLVPIITVLTLCILGTLIYMSIPYVMNFGSWISDIDFSSSENRPLDEPSSWWGNFATLSTSPSPWEEDGVPSSFLENLNQEKLPKRVRQWFNQSSKDYDWNQTPLAPLWLDLWQTERKLAEKKDRESDQINYDGTVQVGTLRWQTSRYDDLEKAPLVSGFFEQVLKQQDGNIEVSLRRIVENNQGVAHRFLYDGQGLLSWNWRFRIKEKTLEGSLRFSRDRKKIVLSHQGALPWGPSRTTLTLKNKLKIMPAVYWPHMRLDDNTWVLLPYAQKIVKAKHYFANLNIDHQDGHQLDLKDADGAWTEKWRSYSSSPITRL